MADLPQSLARILAPPAAAAPAPGPTGAALVASLISAGAPLVEALRGDRRLVPSAAPLDVRAATPSAAPIPFVVPSVAGPAPIVMDGSAFAGIKNVGRKKRGPTAAEPSAPTVSLAKLLDMKDEDLKFVRMSRETRREGVQPSMELERIVAIPRRVLAPDSYEADLTDKYRRPGGTMRLRPVQSAIIHEAARANGLLGCAAAGSGKCVLGETEIFDAGNGMRRRADQTGSFEVATTDSVSRTVISSAASSFRSGKKECLKLRLANGQQLSCSTDHPILTPDGYKPASQLKIDDFVAVARRMPEPPHPVSLTPAQVKFIALMMADGECSHNMIFTNAAPALLEEFKEITTALGGILRYAGPSGAAHMWQAKRGGLKKWFGHLGLLTLSKHKRLPASLYGMDRASIALFLNRFIACDGHINTKSRVIDIVLASEGLIKDLRFLLLRLGIPSRTSFKLATNNTSEAVFPCWRLVVGGKDAVRLLTAIGPVLSKEVASEKLLSDASRITHNTNVDVVPVSQRELKLICDELGFPARGYGRAKQGRPRGEARTFLGLQNGARRSVGRELFKAFCLKHSYVGRFAWLVSDDIGWERVIRTRRIGVRPVYDLTVPATQNFLAEGMVVHNTLASLLVGAEMGAKKIVLLVPPQLRAQLLSVDIPKLNQHFFLPLDRLRIVAYSELSNARTHDILDQIKPDVIVADEAHSLKLRQAARTKRFNRYFREHPECRFVGLSGTITRKSLVDYQHLSELALKKNSPLPNSWHALCEWSEAIDVSDDPMPPGALLKLCDDEERAAATDPGALADTGKAAAAHRAVRSAFRRRLIETPGVVATSESAVGTSLVINAVRPVVPAEVTVAIRELRRKWEIAGDELTDILEVSRIARQLAAGIFTRWDWPNKEVDYDWLAARSAWHKEVREVLKRSLKGMDSPLLVTKAVLDGRVTSENYSRWAEVKSRWRPEPPRETVWISDFLVKYAVEWGHENGTRATPAIIWYQHVEIGQAIARVGGFPFFGAGSAASEELTKVDTKKTPCIVASIKAHGVGKNLQQFNTGLITTCPSSGADMEQLIARNHRPGQDADEVRFDVCVHTEELADAFSSALRDAQYIEDSQGQKQKLNLARLIGF